MKSLYVAYHVEKTAQKWTEGKGADFKDMHTVMSQRVDISSDTLSGLLSAIQDEFCYDDNYFSVSGTRVGFNRFEDDDSNIIDSSKLKNGQTCWLCDYDFLIEKRVVDDVPVEEFGKLAGKKFQLDVYED